MQHYYLNLPKNGKLPLETNLKVSDGIRYTAQRAFEPFEHYLNKAITNLEIKSEIKAHWKPLKEQNLAVLELIGNIYEIQEKKGWYQIISEREIEDDDFEEPIIYVIDGKRNRLKIDSNSWDTKEIYLENCTIKHFDKITWCDQDLELKPLWEESTNDNGIILSSDNNATLIYFENNYNAPKNAKKVKNISAFIDWEQLEKQCEFERKDGLNILLNDEQDFNKKIISGHISLKICKPQKQNEENFYIQLEEIEENQSDELIGRSPLDAFFDDDIEVTDDQKNTYQVRKGRSDEFQIILQGKDRKPCLPKGDILQVKANTYQLRKQLEATRALKNMPVGEHNNLISLFEDVEKVRWKNSNWNSQDLQWQVLTDGQRKGSTEQRDFVKKALKTPDFAILEGPPGSGKTTVILELICQLAQQGKRVLLCGSTHVAIDNVLERLDEKRNGSTLAEKFNILPIRIGDVKRISDSVEKFQLDNLVSEHSINEHLLLDSSNLVCGTTIGILQHPKFKQRNENRNWETAPIVPEFDYLIIDESSKTTFQEFLVPALYAKKWVLVGDVMQLSPFTDREEIVSNLKEIQFDNSRNNSRNNKKQKIEVLDPALQQAIFCLHLLSKNIGKNNRFILPLTEKELNYFEQEVKAREETLQSKRIAFVKNRSDYQPLELVGYDLVVIDQSLLEHIELPPTHTLLRKDEWQQNEHAFKHKAYPKHNQFDFQNRGKRLTNSFDIVDILNTEFKERSWADEIAWRIDREHQLRLVSGKKNANYNKQIEDLLPYSQYREETLEQINTIASMAFPSILESLVNGIKGRKTKVKSTISEGFRNKQLDYRRTILKYQQRMHPCISEFPRQQFYQKDGALQDGKVIREWTYEIYNERSIWCDVKGVTNGNKNIAEVRKIIEELECFINFAKNNPHPEGDKAWQVGVLTFYRGQEKLLREALQKLTSKPNAFSSFNIKGTYPIEIKLHTVDKFQGQEADIVFLSMVQTNRDGFLDNPNRLNVGITRAKYQLVIVGNYEYFSQKSRSDDLKELALHHKNRRIN
ncbi:AAA domain-containing protein [Pasteurella skyensis]|uniref:AAA domain-containing protein n=1 Tax=Phocoenobacter skyensis TaxID=97481 RepID=A0AAJ6N8S5_9PAST|nr:AAA domain-containing protein [Pasteurella skyensis]MDP8172301.1 AAA domain-containing protein [Pasteurella skyensis]MDP8178556.1 AAA domain-containing protein [Pasteurella skyensis]MDP8182558.1 AAA domain-containing protein [Pasteurella skyensis]MDP8188863.1 AAA domain-containing protein [Pasteurella skyensis]